MSQDQLLAQSDFIVLAVPLTNETKHMINKDTLGKMKSNAIVVNVGRGGKEVTESIIYCYAKVPLHLILSFILMSKVLGHFPCDIKVASSN